MLNWLLGVLGLGPVETPGRTASAPRDETMAPVSPFDHAPPAPFAAAPFGHAPTPPEITPPEITPPEPTPPEPTLGEPTLAEPALSEPRFPEPALPDPVPEDAAAIAPDAAAPFPAAPFPAAPAAPPALHFAAFTVQSLAGGRVFARPEDGHLVHQPGDLAPGGWEVHGFVTDAHPGILFVLAAEGPTSLSGGGAIAHAFRIEESGDDAFALFDLATDAYLCAPQFQPGVNTLENDRGVVDTWEMFHLVAAEGVTLPAVLPPLLPPAGTPITEARLQAWRAA